MSHELEITKAGAAMAYAGEKPWHGLGVKVPYDVTPVQMLQAADCDWEVEKRQAYIFPTEGSKAKIKINSAGLIRKSDGKLLDTVTMDWNPVQNREAAEFFNDFVMAGDMQMETVGSLKGGRMVWCLAKSKESFELFKGDATDMYLLLTNFHMYGHSTDGRFTAVRVVCNNTHQMAMSSTATNIFKYTHRRQFDPEKMKEAMGIGKAALAKYKEQAQFLGSKKAKPDDVVEYFKALYPGSATKLKDISKNAEIVASLLETQPGAEFATGTWWQPFNAVTYFNDHKVCKTTDQRLAQSWYGTHRTLKAKALDLALEYAGK